MTRFTFARAARAATALLIATPALVRAQQGYRNPTESGGSLLTQIPGSTLGEPINVIISADSDAEVLQGNGTLEYFESLYYSPGDCAGISLGGLQAADLGGGDGYVNQSDVMRFNYYRGDIGTCIQSANGGNHFRWWPQNTGAVFLAASYSEDAEANHMISDNGYDLGRDLLVANATNATGTTSPGGTQYSTTVTQSPLLQDVATSDINHGIPIDGRVSILTVRITATGQETQSSGSGSNGGSSSSSSGSSASNGDQSSAAAELPASWSAMVIPVLFAVAWTASA